MRPGELIVHWKTRVASEETVQRKTHLQVPQVQAFHAMLGQLFCMALGKRYIM